LYKDNAKQISVRHKNWTECDQRGGISMTYDSLKSLVDELVTKVEDQGNSTKMLESEYFESLQLDPTNFKEIKEITKPKKIAYVDGGNRELLRATNYVVELNHLYFSIFQGRERIIPLQLNPRIEFFSYVVSKINKRGSKSEIFYDTNLFPYKLENKKLLPEPSDLSFSSTDRTMTIGNQRAVINSVSAIARRFSEKSFAYEIVENELSEGDILILDGSLQNSFTNERKYSKKLFDAGLKNGVIICGLTKTSTLFTDTGTSLLGSVSSISEEVKLGRWYIPVAIPKFEDVKGMIFVVKLHPQSEHVFRFEIFIDQYNELNEQQIDDIFSSLASNSNDLAMLGYPYGLIDADTHARVRLSDKEFYHNILLSEISRHPEWKKIMVHSKTHTAHDDLNLAVG